MVFKKNVARTIVFVMVDATDLATLKTGLTVTAEISKDGGAFAASTNSVAEIGSGFYSLLLTAGEMNANVVAVKCTATGAAYQNLIFYTVENVAKDIMDRIGAPVGTDISADIQVIDGNVDTLVTRVPSEVAQKLHLVSGIGNITPPTNKGIWDSLGDGTRLKNITDGLSAQAKLDVNAEVDSALDTAIPVTPTADSINERIKSIDDKLPTGNISDFDETTDRVTLTTATETQIDNIEAYVDKIDDTTDGLTAIRSKIDLVKEDIGDPSADATTIYAQVKKRKIRV
uniref:Uncharacterized protein n=1 Tax=viral metagenome TaxID=1070528 RepID=A0A6H1ZQE5_9ZZZZ